MAKEFSYKVGVDPDKGIQGLRELGRAAKDHLGDVNNTLEKGQDDAKAFAQAMRDAADKVEQRLKDTARASDALGKALGPELAARLGQNGLDKMATDMNQAGLAFDQITRDADELADGIKRLEQAGQSIGSRVAPEFDKVEAASGKANSEMDKSRSVVANFAGNAAQDLPGVSGAFGALNVAVGQFAEYASEGGIGMKNFLKSAAGLGLATGAFMVINKVMGDMAKAKEEARRQTQAFADALKEEAEGADDAVNALIAKELVDKKLTKGLDGLGVSAMDVARVIKGESVPAFEKLTDGLSEHSLITHDVSAEARGLTEEQAKLILTVRDLTKRHADGAEIEHERANIQAALGIETKKTTETIVDQTKASEDAAAAMQEQLDTALSLIDSQFRLADAQDDLTQAIEEFNTTTDDAATSIDEKAQAERDASRAALELAAAAAQQAEDQAKANGETLTATQTAQVQIDKLAEVANSLDPSSVLRKNLMGYIDTLKSIPATVSTDLQLTGQERQNALKDRQQLAADGIVLNLTNRIEVGGKTVEAITQQIRLKDRQLQ
ncbi:MAG: hypothetical protein IT480_18550 [Gammaproteobacteria bacterium]|nr:hypothetical protein [Gammaproteobacteria bacterium]